MSARSPYQSWAPGRSATQSDHQPRRGKEVERLLRPGRQQRGADGVEISTMVLATIVLRLFAFVHDHFLSTHKVLQLYDAQAPARSNRDARRRRWWTWRTRRTRRRLGRRRMGRRPWRRTRRRRHLGFEGPSRCLILAYIVLSMARGDWSLASTATVMAWKSRRIPRRRQITCDQRLIGAGHSRTRLTVPARLLPRCRYSRPHHRSRDASIVPIAGAARALRHDRSPAVHSPAVGRSYRGKPLVRSRR